mmetsp:Transcript_10799/g.28842  ORF Transcript_10799/g.28842 Transcript_10799/m.28842 type:complete len:324 (+) Transcript_10799:850-1821(+)
MAGRGGRRTATRSARATATPSGTAWSPWRTSSRPTTGARSRRRPSSTAPTAASCGSGGCRSSARWRKWWSLYGSTGWTGRWCPWAARRMASLPARPSSSSRRRAPPRGRWRRSRSRRSRAATSSSSGRHTKTGTRARPRPAGRAGTRRTSWWPASKGSSATTPRARRCGTNTVTTRRSGTATPAGTPWSPCKTSSRPTCAARRRPRPSPATAACCACAACPSRARSRTSSRSWTATISGRRTSPWVTTRTAEERARRSCSLPTAAWPSGPWSSCRRRRSMAATSSSSGAARRSISRPPRSPSAAWGGPPGWRPRCRRRSWSRE